MTHLLADLLLQRLIPLALYGLKFPVDGKVGLIRRVLLILKDAMILSFRLHGVLGGWQVFSINSRLGRTDPLESAKL